MEKANCIQEINILLFDFKNLMKFCEKVSVVKLIQKFLIKTDSIDKV